MFHNLKKRHISKVATNLKNGDSDRQLTLFDYTLQTEFVRLAYHHKEAIKLLKTIIVSSCPMLHDGHR